MDIPKTREINGFGVLLFKFGDGSTVGGLRAYMDAGIIRKI